MTPEIHHDTQVETTGNIDQNIYEEPQQEAIQDDTQSTIDSDDDFYYLPKTVSCITQIVASFYEHRGLKFCTSCLPDIRVNSEYTFQIRRRHSFIHLINEEDLLCIGCDTQLLTPRPVEFCPICIEYTIFVDDFRSYIHSTRETIINEFRTRPAGY